MSQDVDLNDYNQLRLALRRAMPAEAFEPQPLRGVIALLLVPFNVFVLGGLVVNDALPWWGDLAIGLVLSQLWVTVGFTAHEALHRSVFKSRFWEDVLGWVGFAPWLLTPGLWRAWHVQAHHGGTNVDGHDPDMLFTVDQWKAGGLPRFVYAVTPGSGHWISYISPTFLFTMQGQVFLWVYADKPEFEKVRMHRTRERVLSGLLALAWIALGVWLGPWDAWCLIVLPMMASNATLMAYIASNHWLMPTTPDGNNPFANTASVSVSPAWDVLHVNFAWHQEHHIFPQMNPKFAPLLRETLTRMAPEAVHVMPIGAAIQALYSRPPLYASGDTFSNPDGTVIVSVDSARPPTRPTADAASAAA